MILLLVTKTTFFHGGNNMGKWVLTKNGHQEIFDNYNKALHMFLGNILDHLCTYRDRKDGYSSGLEVYDYECVPYAVGIFFNKKFNDETITGEEIAINKTLAKLLSLFLSRNPKQIKEKALKIISATFSYKEKDDEFDEKLNIVVRKRKDEIALQIIANNRNENRFKINAFIMDDPTKRYYFESKQRVIVSTKKDCVGKVVEIDLSLEPLVIKKSEGDWKNEYLTSNEFDTIFNEIAEIKVLSVAWIQTKWKLSFQKAKALYEEWLRYNDEVFFHNALYELSFEEEPPTIARIIRKFQASYPLAKKIYEFYTENC